MNKIAPACKRFWALALIGLAFTSACAPAPAKETVAIPTSIKVVIPTPAPIETQLPDLGLSELVTCRPYLCSSAAFWKLGPNGPEALSLPIKPGLPYDSTASTGRLLYSTTFPDHGAGPGNVSVGDLWWLDVRSGQTRPILSDAVVAGVAWADNGQNFAYVRATPETYELRWYTAFGEDKLLAKDVAFIFSVSPGGDQIAFTRESNYNLAVTPGLYVVDIATGQERQIATVDRAGRGSMNDKPIWSPDSMHILLPVAGEVNSWLIASTDGSQSDKLSISPEVSQVLQNYDLGFDLWSPDGVHLVGSSFSGMQGGPSKVMLFGLNPALDTVISAKELKDDNSIVASWDTPGDSVWVLPPSGSLESVPVK